MKTGFRLSGTFCPEIVKRLVSAALVTDRETRLAFQFAENIGILRTFSIEKEMAYYDWLYSFLKRAPEVSVIIAQSLTLARTQGLNRKECCGTFLPPNLILKRTDKNQYHLEALPPGYNIFMNPIRACVNAELLLKLFSKISRKEFIKIRWSHISL
ncbi:hypothetical protein PR048_009802 [Dryococelus australis]|uniref:Uncharacterized protein n=1 Tax=Dryococelus australis TaxID=614101 RepID=A0ABQ9I0Y9_9NEOP|nr:hypothetical protein PR048_009802 [Dryococelus australis]